MKNLALAVALAATGSGLAATGASATTPVIVLAPEEVDTTVDFTTSKKLDSVFNFSVSAKESLWELTVGFSDNAISSTAYPFGHATLDIYSGLAGSKNEKLVYTATAADIKSTGGTKAHPIYSYSESISINSGNDFTLKAGNYNIDLVGSTLPSVGGAGTLAVTATVPEVSTWVMMLAGFAGLGLVGYGGSNKARGPAA